MTSTLLYNRKHQEKLAAEVNERVREAAESRRKNRKIQQDAGIIPSRKSSSHNVVVQMPPSPAFGTSGGYRNRQPVHHDRLSGSKKRRRRRGGNPKGGPGRRGAGMRPNTPRSRRGFLVEGLS